MNHNKSVELENAVYSKAAVIGYLIKMGVPQGTITKEMGISNRKYYRLKESFNTEALHENEFMSRRKLVDVFQLLDENPDLLPIDPIEEQGRIIKRKKHVAWCTGQYWHRNFTITKSIIKNINYSGALVLNIKKRHEKNRKVLGKYTGPYWHRVVKVFLQKDNIKILNRKRTPYYSRYLCTPAEVLKNPDIMHKNEQKFAMEVSCTLVEIASRLKKKQQEYRALERAEESLKLATNKGSFRYKASA